MRIRIAAASVFLALLSAAPAGAVEGASLHIGFLPAAFMTHSSVDDFTAGAYELFDDTSWTPAIFFGYEYDRVVGFGVDLFLSGLVQSDVSGTLFGANVSFILPHPPRSPFRGRLIGGVLLASLDEDSPAVVEFDDSTGWQAGVGIELGRGRFIPLVVDVLYRHLEVDVDQASSDAVSEPSADLSGISLNVGFKFNFY